MTTYKEDKLNLLLTEITSSNKVKNIIKSKPHSPLYITVFKQASMYNEGYLMFKSSMDKSKVLNLISPMLMNLCFSIELLLKTYILFDNKDIYHYSELEERGISIRGHKYSDLFKKINEQYKKNILTELSRTMNLPSIDEEVFKQILIKQNCDNSFAEWRYIFEQDSVKAINTELLMNLNDLLGIHLFKLIKRTE